MSYAICPNEMLMSFFGIAKGGGRRAVYEGRRGLCVNALSVNCPQSKCWAIFLHVVYVLQGKLRLKSEGDTCASKLAGKARSIFDVRDTRQFRDSKRISRA